MRSLYLSVLLGLWGFVFGSEFDRFMGKGTPHWQYVTLEDRQILAPFKRAYNAQRRLLHSSDGAHRIPRVVHFIWLGDKPFPPESVENVRSWMAHHPHWAFKFWTDGVHPAPCNGMTRCQVEAFPWRILKTQFEASENYGEKADLLRYEILLREGGVYVDHDAICGKPFDALNAHFDFYCCLEVPHPPMAGLRITAGNGLVGAIAGHPVIERVIQRVVRGWDDLHRTFRGKDRHSRETLVIERTYLPFTRALLEGMGDRDIALPAAYFLAKGGMPSLYSKHLFANSWAVQRDGEVFAQREVGGLAKRVQRLDLVLALLLALHFPLLYFTLRPIRRVRA